MIGPAHIVGLYLASPEVQLKNIGGQTFHDSLRVFVHNEQTALVSETPSLTSLVATYSTLRARLLKLKEEYSAIVQLRQEATRQSKRYVYTHVTNPMGFAAHSPFTVYLLCSLHPLSNEIANLPDPDGTRHGRHLIAIAQSINRRSKA